MEAKVSGVKVLVLCGIESYILVQYCQHINGAGFPVLPKESTITP